MSKNYYTSVTVKCPYYKDEARQVVRCEGFAQGTVIHLCFADASRCKAYKTDVCKDKYDTCPIWKMLGGVDFDL